MNKCRINNTRFSIELCLVAEAYGFKTIGSITKALKQAKPNTKWYCGTSYVRGIKLLKELEQFREEYYYLNWSNG